MLKFNKKKLKKSLPDRSATSNSSIMRNQYFGDVRRTNLASDLPEQKRFEAKKSSRKKLKRLYKFKKISKRGLYAAGLVGLMVGLWWLSLISTKSYYFSGESNLNITNEYRNNFKKQVSKKINNYTLLNLKSKNIEESLKNEFPDLAEVSIKRIWYKKGIEVNSKFRQPIIKWQSGGEPKYIDQNGMVMSLKPINEQDLYIINDQSGLNFDSGEKIYANRNIIFCKEVISAVKANEAVSIIFENLSIPSTSLKEVDIKLKNGYIVKLSTELNPTKQVNLLAQILTKLGGEGKNPTQYIDLRVPGKVFWK